MASATANTNASMPPYSPKHGETSSTRIGSAALIGPDRPARHTRADGPRRHVPRHDASGADDAAVADGHAHLHDGARRDPGARADDDRPRDERKVPRRV